MPDTNQCLRLTALLPFVRLKWLESLINNRANPEAWETGELVLTDEAVAGAGKQAQALLEE